MSGASAPSVNNAPADGLICSHLHTLSQSTLYNEMIQGIAMSTGKALQMIVNGVTDQPSVTSADVNTWLTNNNVQIIYKLATPIEVDLTPTEITTLLGTNNMWADTGDIEVEYCADTKRYIQKLISQIA